MKKLKDIVDILITNEIYKPKAKIEEQMVQEIDESVITEHPFAGFLSQVVALISNLSYTKNDKVE